MLHKPRVFVFGIGNAPNRFLLDGMAHVGRGAVEYVTLKSKAEDAARRFQERVQAPVLTDITIDWGTLSVADVYPKHIPDLFSGRPIMIYGQLTDPAEGTIVLRGKNAAGPFERQIRVPSPAELAQHNILAALWARAKIKELMIQEFAALQRGNVPEAFRREITALGVQFHLVTQFTGFVAVEEMLVTVGGEPMTIAVPVEMPEGVSYEGVFGRRIAAQPFFSPPSFPSPLFPGPSWPRSSFSMLGPSGVGRGAVLGWSGSGLGSGPPLFSHPSFSAPLSTPSLSSLPFSSSPFSTLRGYHQGYAEDAAIGQAWAHAAWTKLAEPLRGLAEQVATAGHDGNLPVAKLRVIDYRVDVMVYLRDTSARTIGALKQRGFVQTGESKVARLLLGTIDVRKLEQLAELDTVIRVTPVVS